MLAIYWLPWKKLPPFDYTQAVNPNSKVLSAWLPLIAVGVALALALFSALRPKH